MMTFGRTRSGHSSSSVVEESPERPLMVPTEEPGEAESSLSRLSLLSLLPVVASRSRSLPLLVAKWKSLLTFGAGGSAAGLDMLVLQMKDCRLVDYGMGA